MSESEHEERGGSLIGRRKKRSLVLEGGAGGGGRRWQDVVKVEEEIEGKWRVQEVQESERRITVVIEAEEGREVGRKEGKGNMSKMGKN